MPLSIDESRMHIRGSILLVTGRLVSLFLNLLTQVLAIRYLIQADYGAFAFAFSAMEFVGYVSTLGLNKACSRFLPIYQEREEHGKALGLLVMSVATVLGVSGAIILSLVIGRELLSEYLVSSRLSLVLLLTLIALGPVEALDFVFEAFFGAFGEVRVVFMRRYILRPGLKLSAVIGVMLLHADVETLAYFYLLAGVVGFLYYIPALMRVMRQQKVWTRRGVRPMRFPVGEVWRYSGPLVSSHLIFLFQGSVAVLLLEALSGSIAVGEFRAVLPFARLNTVVQGCFVLLFTPLACRFLVRNSGGQIAELYWSSVTWIAVLTFPVFAATTVLSPTLATALLGEEYASASAPMILLALGFFVEALLGLSGQVLRVYARVRYVVIADVMATVASLLLLLLLIPRYGALGAAIGTAGFNVVAHGVYAYFSHAMTPVSGLSPRGLRISVSIVLAMVALLGLQHLLRPHWTGSMLLIMMVWFGLVIAHRRVLAVEQVVPGIAAFPRVCRLLGGVSPSPANDAKETG